MATISKKIDIDLEIFKTISKIAKKENTTETQIINQMIKKGLENSKTPEIPEHLIMNKDTYNPDSKRTKELIGIIKTKEPFDTAKAIREIRGIE
jgi:hypothetical protein